MGQSGNITFFAEQRLVEPRRVLADTAHLVGSAEVGSASRSLQRDRSWRGFKWQMFFTRMARVVPLPSTSRVVGLLESYSGDVPDDWIGGPLSIDEVFTYYRTPYALRVSLDGTSDFITTLQDSVSERLPNDVNTIENGFRFNSILLIIGYHDIWECAEHDNGMLFGRAFYSFSIFGYGTPHNWNRYRELVFDVPEMKKLKTRLERIAGPLQQCVYWST